MSDAYWSSPEAVEWRRLHTWGGFLWPLPEGEVIEMGAVKRGVMSGVEMLDEVQWLLDGEVHPLLAAQVVGRTCEAITTAARRAGRRDLVRVFQRYATEEKARRSTRRAS